jgi:hypothetical protein
LVKVNDPGFTIVELAGYEIGINLIDAEDTWDAS